MIYGAMRDELEKISISTKFVARGMRAGVRSRIQGLNRLMLVGAVNRVPKNELDVISRSIRSSEKVLHPGTQLHRLMGELTRQGRRKTLERVGKLQQLLPKVPPMFKVALGGLAVSLAGMGARAIGGGFGKSLIKKVAPGMATRIAKPGINKAMRYGGTAAEYGGAFMPTTQSTSRQTGGASHYAVS
jgi:hypothetical protein